MPEESLKHFYGYGPHRCKRGHSYKIKFNTNRAGVTSGYIKICRRCSREEVRLLTQQGNKLVSVKSGDYEVKVNGLKPDSVFRDESRETIRQTASDVMNDEMMKAVGGSKAEYGEPLTTRQTVSGDDKSQGIDEQFEKRTDY